MNDTIEIGCDHAGVELKELIIKHLESKGIKTNDHGAYSAESVDYPDFAQSVCKAVIAGSTKTGILICGSGNGINMTANKYAQIRSALCWTAEIAQLARQHNNANVIALPARFIEKNEALKAIDLFLNTAFEGGRHEKRVNKISC